jgi:hypothetical protein
MEMHQKGCPRLGNHSDTAKRIADTYNLHRVAKGYDAIGCWIVCALQDGSSDQTLYDSKQDAIKHQHNNENYYVFIQIVPASMTICDAEIMLKVARQMYSKGWRLSDGDSRRELIRRLSREDQVAISNGVVTNLRIGRN